MSEYNEWKMQQTYDEWKSDIIEYFIREIDIWTKHFVNGRIEQIKIFIVCGAYKIGIELLQGGVWYQVCFSDDNWQTKYLENVSYVIRDNVKGSCFLNELWVEFCDETIDNEKSRMINDIVEGLQKRYNCKVTAINERIQLKI